MSLSRPVFFALVLAGCATPRPVSLHAPKPAPPLTLGVDTHIHPTISHAAKPVFLGEPGQGTTASSTRVRMINQIEAEHLRRAGVRLLFASVWTPINVRPHRSALDETVLQLQGLWDFTQRHGDYSLVRTVAQAKAALAAGQIVLYPQIEGAEGITEVDDVDVLYRAGVRVIMPMHFVDTALGAAAWGQALNNVFGVKSVGVAPEGISALGRAAVERMMDLGIVVDVAHASDKFANAVLDLAEARGVPVIYSHGGARAFNDKERNISDALARRVAKSGGVVGVTLMELNVANVPAEGQWEGFQPDTCDNLVAHWVHLAQVVGPEAMVMGSDFNGFIARGQAGGLCPDGLRNTSDLPQLFAALEARGVPRAALDGMGARLLSVLEAVEAKANPQARARALALPVRVVHSFEPR